MIDRIFIQLRKILIKKANGKNYCNFNSKDSFSGVLLSIVLSEKSLFLGP